MMPSWQNFFNVCILKAIEWNEVHACVICLSLTMKIAIQAVLSYNQNFLSQCLVNHDVTLIYVKG